MNKVGPGRRFGGRAKGVPNKVTTEVREVIAAFARKHAPEVSKKLSQIEDPAKWCDIYFRAIEYHIPKLKSVEVQGTGPEGAITFVIEKYAKPEEG